MKTLIRELKKQHKAILMCFEKINAILKNKEELTDEKIETIVITLNQLNSLIIEHISTENYELYPVFLKSNDTAEIITSSIKRILPFGKIIFIYIQKWNDFGRIFKNLKEFEKETIYAYKKIFIRISSEESLIFPTAKKDFGQHNIEPMLKPDKAKLNKIKQTSKGVSFPTIPDIVTQLDKETQKTNVDMNKIGKLVSKDPIIAGAIVKTINSPLFASKVKITSISHATMMMGLNNFRNMIISALVKNIFEDENENINNIWVESLIVAKYCAEISKLTEGVETDEAYMLGLFHDAGSLLLARKFVDEYTGVLFTLNEKPLSVPLKEKKFFDVNHCSIGYILAKKWKLDEVLCQAIYLHHIPSIKKLKNKKLKKMIAMVKLANLLAKGYNPDQMSFEDAQYEHDALQELKLNNIQLKTLRMKNMSTG